MKLYENHKKAFFKEIGKTLRDLRLAQEISMPDFKEITGFTCTKLNDIECGEESRLLALPIGQLMRLFENFNKKFRFVVEDLTLEERIGDMLESVSSEDLIKLVALRSEKESKTQEVK